MQFRADLQMRQRVNVLTLTALNSVERVAEVPQHRLQAPC